MATITLNILEERAMEVIRYLEKVKDVEVISTSESDDIDDQLTAENEGSELAKRESWIKATEDRRKGLLTHADRVEVAVAAREAWVDKYLHKATDPASPPKKLVQRNWYGILADHPDKDAMTEYFDNIRDEWEDRY